MLSPRAAKWVPEVTGQAEGAGLEGGTTAPIARSLLSGELSPLVSLSLPADSCAVSPMFLLYMII